MNAGKVWIVGAGPGAPDLLTLRAARAIEQAQVLIWTDSLVNPQLAAMAPADCERIRTSTLTLEEVMALMLERVAAGRRVVRLHDGDTCLYSALNEQLCRLLDTDVEVEMTQFKLQFTHALVDAHHVAQYQLRFLGQF